VAGRPIWSSEEDELWMFQVNPDKRKRNLIRINLTDNSVTNINEDVLDDLLGFETSVAPAVVPTVSPDGQYLLFSIFGDGDVRHHNIVYPLDGSETILAVCDNFDFLGEYVYPFWSPDNRYIGYWNGGVVHALDTETGDIFRLPNEGGGFIGWIEDE
jgi:Tol biopolymer transport system component